MRDANGRNHRPAGTPGAGRFENERDDSDLDMDEVPDIPRLPPEPEPTPDRGRRRYLTTAAITGGIVAAGTAALFGVARLGTVPAGWIVSLPHPGPIVGVGGAVLLAGVLALDPRLRK